MVNSTTYGSSRPTWLVINYVVLLFAIISFVVYTSMNNRDIFNAIERMEMQERHRDEKIQKFERRINELEREIRACQIANKDLMVKKIHHGVLKKRQRRDMGVDARIGRLSRLMEKLMNTSLVVPVYLRGKPGPKGPAGAVGLPGYRGKPGPIGPRGLKGDQGTSGPTGPQGSKGDPGLKGRSGENGQKGVKGQKGDSVSVPKITTHPQSQAVLKSDSATFTCAATGNPKPVIQLARLNGTMDTRYKKIGNGMLEIENVRPEDEGKLTCVAKSVLGKDVSTAMLEVLVAANAKITSKSIEAEEGYDIKINCVVTGNPRPAIKWHRSGKRLPSNVNFEDQKKTLVIRKAKLDDSGSYVCNAENYLLNSTAQTNFLVRKRLSFFFKSSSSIQSFEYQDLTISCFYEHGVQPITVKWLKDGKTFSGGNISFKRNKQVLTIKNIHTKDAGKYKCIIQSKYSVLYSETSVYVDHPKSCKDIRRGGVIKSGHYMIKPSKQSIMVYCDMTSNNEVGVIVISHDSESRTGVSGIEAAGGYKRQIKYEISKEDLKAIVQSSDKCEQSIKYECKGSMISESGFAWWVSGDGKRMRNWGGVDHTKTGCACSLTNSCAKGVCNCDKNDLVWREDSGVLNEKQFLPISEVRFGDTGDAGEQGYHTVGKLKCY